MKKTIVWVSIALLVVLAGFVIYQRTKKVPREVVFTVWHTESDENARKVLEEVAAEVKKQVESEWRERGDPRYLTPKVQYVPWGQLAMKLSAVSDTSDEPDLSHLEPYMTASFFRAGKLIPIDETIERLSATHRILPSVAHLQTYSDHTYGLAYAVGTTFYSYRRDWVSEGHLDFVSAAPKTWAELLAYMPQLQRIARSHGADNVVLLPGGDPFFLDQFFGEVLASYGVSLFVPERGTFAPAFDDERVFEVLKELHRLAPYLVNNWDTVSYLDQFQMFAKGKALLLPVTYARATGIIQHSMQGANDKTFGVLRQPGKTSDMGRGTIDCEDWVIFRKPRITPEIQLEKREIARRFLDVYYSKEYYLRFTEAVPVHLTPIFDDLSNRQNGAYWSEPKVAQWLSSWRSWADQSQAMLSQPGRVNPILMSSAQDNENPFIFECQKARVMTDMLQVALRTSSSDTDIRQAQHDAQQRALEIIQHQKF